jgi:hypothetical protein
MAYRIETIEQLAWWLGDGPDYEPGAPGWAPLSLVRMWVGVTETGLARMRERYGFRYEHRVKNQVLIYFPKWSRLWGFEYVQSKHG